MMNCRILVEKDLCSTGDKKPSISQHGVATTEDIVGWRMGVVCFHLQGRTVEQSSIVDVPALPKLLIVLIAAEIDDFAGRKQGGVDCENLRVV
ncbi:hypothetical protein [Nitrosospira lacus]|uniref:hypothetical protein n=1 Tax=Nitrosospira lacus TaxID=1288494 RepID=UPI00137470E6|nr:hypothetical protein [Nitrosospira lacus]